MIRAMLEQLWLMLRDAQSYGFDAARFAYGVVLSQMEDGTLSWDDGHIRVTALGTSYQGPSQLGGAGYQSCGGRY
jgi:hypothetical protein